MKCSVIICTYNPRENYLQRTLTALQNQTLPVEEWELLIIDNACQNPLANRIDLNWHPHGRHIREDKIGLTHARLRGISESQGDYLIFVDDDNVVKSDYLEAGIKIGVNYPWLGTWGGSCIPEYEIQPPAEIRQWLGCLALYKATTPIWAKLQVYTEACPCGAGMVVRRSVALHYAESTQKNPIRQSLDRSGKSLGAGGDIDMDLTSSDLGLGVGRFPELELVHLIPAARLNVEYISGVFEGFGYSEVTLGAIHQPGYQSPIQHQRRLWLIKALSYLKRPAVRKVEVAEARGRLRAFLDLKKLGYFQ